MPIYPFGDPTAAGPFVLRTDQDRAAALSLLVLLLNGQQDQAREALHDYLRRRVAPASAPDHGQEG